MLISRKGSVELDSISQVNLILGCWKLLQDEIAAKHARIRILSSQGTVDYSNLAALVSSVDLIHLKSVSDCENTKRLNQHQKIQDRKLFRLCAETKSDSSIDPNTVVFNFS